MTSRIVVSILMVNRAEGLGNLLALSLEMEVGACPKNGLHQVAHILEALDRVVSR